MSTQSVDDAIVNLGSAVRSANAKPIPKGLLRDAADAQLAHAQQTDDPARTAEELLHELHLHQIELEMQNKELRRAQLVIEEMRDRYVDLYEFAPVGYLTLTREGRISEANLTGAEMLGVGRKELLKRHFAGFLIPEDGDKWHLHFVDVLRRNGRQSCELQIRRANGTSFYAEITSLRASDTLSSASPDDLTFQSHIPNASLLLRVVITDITERRLLALKLSKLSAQLEAVREDEKANIARELHDELGSTLAVISMGIGRLTGKISAPALVQDLSEIKDLVSTASQITRGVVDQLYPTILDAYGIVAAVSWLVDGYRKHSGIAVELLMPKEDVAMEHAFALAAYRITQECLTNIAKHAKASKVRIEVKASDGFLDLTIHDNGNGLSGKIASDSHGILGMIERARHLGGSLEIGSENGNGTTARLRLAMAAAKPKNRMRVLVADDHAIIRNALRDMLANQTDDFSVEGEAGDGNAAIQMAIEGSWDIMLMDISMPKKTGIKALEKIKAVKPGLPIIMLSSHSTEKYGEIVLSKGAAGYIEKGETSKLIEAMRRATLLQ